MEVNKEERRSTETAADIQKVRVIEDDLKALQNSKDRELMDIVAETLKEAEAAADIEEEARVIEDDLKALLDPKDWDLMDIIARIVKEVCDETVKKFPRPLCQGSPGKSLRGGRGRGGVPISQSAVKKNQGGVKGKHRKYRKQIKEIGKIVKSIAAKLKNDVIEKSLFVDNFEEWKSCRENTIMKLTEIAELINKERFNCNVARLVGSSAGIVGGLVALGSIIAAPFTLGVSLFPAIAGTATAVAGGTTTLGTAITEFVLLKNHINTAQDIIKKDEEHLKSIKEWMQRTAELAKAIEDFLGLDLTRELMEDFKHVIQEIRSNGNVEIISTLKSTIATAVPKLAAQLEVDVQLRIGMQIVNLVIGMIVVFACWQKNNPLVFESMILVAKCVSGIAIAVDLSIDASTAIATRFFPSSNLIARGLAQATVHGVFASVSIALDITNFVLTSIDMNRGSISGHAKSIMDIVTQLEKELEAGEILYIKIWTSMDHTVDVSRPVD